MDTLALFDAPMDENFYTYALLKNSEVRKDRNGKDYLSFTLQDKSGLLEAKLWGVTSQDIRAFQAGRVVYLYGKRELFNKQPQFRIHDIRLAEEGEPTDPTLYAQAAPLSADDIALDIEAALQVISRPKIEKLVRHLLAKVGDDFYQFPAAKRLHHAYLGGLGFHTVTMLRLAEAVSRLYPGLDMSLLYGAIILHDLGKTVELSDPLSAEYTTVGNLLGHISIVSEMLAVACEELGFDQTDEEIVLLKHMVLSHHGKLEYGSPVVPRLMEAEVLHRLDDFDASMQMMRTALEATEPGEFTTRLVGMGGREFYRPKCQK